MDRPSYGILWDTRSGSKIARHEVRPSAVAFLPCYDKAHRPEASDSGKVGNKVPYRICATKIGKDVFEIAEETDWYLTKDVRDFQRKCFQWFRRQAGNI